MMHLLFQVQKEDAFLGGGFRMGDNLPLHPSWGDSDAGSS